MSVNGTLRTNDPGRGLVAIGLSETRHYLDEFLPSSEIVGAAGENGDLVPSTFNRVACFNSDGCDLMAERGSQIKVGTRIGLMEEML